MRAYELVLVLKTSLNEANRKKLLESVKSLLKDAKNIKEDEWGQKPLAYSIKKEIAGFYVDMAFEQEAEIPKDLEKKILANENVLRHLLLRQNSKAPLPSKASKTKGK
ncbi:MAG: 30S ribosomal protein S6 [Patescibacteria group bacterium]|nr:30S ribosomal protein S6 [Patescibacteria group bacterium]